MRDSLYTDRGVASPTRLSDAGTPVLDYIKPIELVRAMIDAGAYKAALPPQHMFVRGMYGGGLLAFATSIAFGATQQTKLPIVGGLIFPVGFAIITLLGLEVITGSFALVPLAFVEKRISFTRLLVAFFWVYLGNLAGSVLYAAMLWVALTTSGQVPDTTGLAAFLIKTGHAKSTHYVEFGSFGFFTAFVKAMLCNWMVTLGVVLPMASRSAVGKVLANYVPIMMFFSLGYEHCVVNMFIMPAAMMFGANISMSDWWVGNELPVTLGNLVGGFLFTGAALGWTYRTRSTMLDEPLPPIPQRAAV